MSSACLRAARAQEQYMRPCSGIRLLHAEILQFLHGVHALDRLGNPRPGDSYFKAKTRAV